MNKVILEGRLTRDPQVSFFGDDNSRAVARFSLAVSRNFKNAQGQYDADFPNCVAYGKTAEFIDKFFKQGDPMIAIGSIRTGKYTKDDGTTVYTTDVNVDSVEFTLSRRNDQDTPAVTPNPAMANNTGFMNIPDNASDELPFM